MTRPTWRSASAWRPCSSRSLPFLRTRAAPASTRPPQKRPARQRKAGLILENGEWVWQDLNLGPHPETKIARVPTGSAAREPSLAGQARFSSLVAAPGHAGLISKIQGTAVRQAVFAGHARPSGSKLLNLIPPTS